MAEFTMPVSTEMFSDSGIAANSGTAYMAVGTQNMVLFYINKLDAKITKNKVDVKVAGKRAVGKKTTSWAGTGTLSVKQVTSFFKEMTVQYTSGGDDLYFSIQIVNEDSKYGREVKNLTGCNFDDTVIAYLSNEDALLEMELPFSFDGVELLEKFNSV